MKNKKYLVAEIAQKTGRHRSTIYRELKRNTKDIDTGYLPDEAHRESQGRRGRCLLKINKDPELKKTVLEQLKIGWSPESIAGRMKKEGSPFLVSQETIYQFIYSEEGRRLGLFQYLLRGRPKRGLRGSRKMRKSIIPDRTSIHDRPKEVETRKEFGHLEADLTFCKDNQSMNITMIIERKTRLVRLIRNTSKHTHVVIKGIFNVVASMQPLARLSMTFDNGTEFIKHTLLKKFMGMATYFCDKHSPWQKGAVEKANSMLHRYLPKKANLKTYSDWQITQIEKKMNATPRKCLGFRTPLEAWDEELAKSVALQA